MGVDRSKFKNCQQSSFCQRNRQHKPFEQAWNVDLSTLTTTSDKTITAQLYDRNSDVKLSMVLSMTEQGAIRMKIDELNSKRGRYEPVDALNPSLKFGDLRIESQDEQKVSFLFGTFRALQRQGADDSEVKRNLYRLVIQASPFKATVTNLDGKVIVVANGHGLMRFEEYRELQLDNPVEEKPIGMPKTAQAYDEAGKPIGESDDNNPEASNTEGESQQNPPENSNAQVQSYAESFSTFRDSRPYGPMSVGMDIHFPSSDHVYGIPEHADTFALRDTKPNIGDPYRLYNVDIFEYEINTPMSLYGAIPFMISHSVNVGTFGVYWLNPSDTWIDIESNKSQSKNAGVVDMISNLVAKDNSLKGRLTHWFSETGLIDVWFMPGPDAPTVMSYNAEAFGTIPMPPMYSIGFHQCRWNYYSAEEVMQVQDGYNEADIPLDAIWLDVEYTAGRSKKYFTWDPVTFSDPVQLANNLTKQGRRLITIIDPHIKKEPGYNIYDEGTSLDMWVKDASQTEPYDGWCWPGSSVWPDYLQPKVREWWASKFDPSHFPGDPNTLVDIWNDMNEPSVFSGPEVTAPRDIRHVDGWEHRDLHNIYGLLMTKATYEGMAKHRGHLDRPFILTRSMFAGSQRYCAVWTGDNMANWDHLKATIPMLLSISIAGMPFVGADVGGFFNNPESEELLIRWHQAGAFQPFFRAHAHHDSRRREAYLFEGETRSLLRDAIRQRSFYAPYWYTLFFESHMTGMPMMRPHWFSDPQDGNTLDIEDQYSLGVALLIKPITEKGVTSVNVYLPGSPDTSSWYDLTTKVMRQGGQMVAVPVTLATIPIFQRAGSIVPRHNIARRSLEIGAKDPINLDIVLGQYNATSYAHGNLYLDEHKLLHPDSRHAVYKDISYYGELLHVRPSTQARLGFGIIERIIIYNWPTDKRIISITSASSAEGSGAGATKLSFMMGQPKEDGTSQLEIRRPQLSLDWLEWKMLISTA